MPSEFGQFGSLHLVLLVRFELFGDLSLVVKVFGRERGGFIEGELGFVVRGC